MEKKRLVCVDQLSAAIQWWKLGITHSPSGHLLGGHSENKPGRMFQSVFRMSDSARNELTLNMILDIWAHVHVRVVVTRPVHWASAEARSYFRQTKFWSSVPLNPLIWRTNMLPDYLRRRWRHADRKWNVCCYRSLLASELIDWLQRLTYLIGFSK